MFPLTTIICDQLQLEQETKMSTTDHELEQIQNKTYKRVKSIPAKPSSGSSDDNVTAATDDCSKFCCRSLSSSLSLASSPSFARLKTPTTTKEVRFATTATVRPIRRLSLDTHAHLWHSDAEKHINEQEMVKHVKNFRRKSKQEQQECISHDHMRGLEQFASASFQRQHQEERQTLLHAVLKAQNFQREQSTKNPGNACVEAQATSNAVHVEENALDLALVSAALSMPARKRALALGLQDAED